MAKIKLVNLVSNGSFENGTTGWSGLRSGMSVDSTTSVHGDSCLKCTGINATYQWCFSNVFSVIRGHILYSSVMARNNDAKTAWGLYVNKNGTQYGNLNVSQVGSTHDTFTKISKRLTVPELEVYTINMLLYGEHSTANSSLVSYWDNVLCVDLTDAFGAGNEPTQDWCDKHISWFEGSIFIEDDGYIMYNYVPDPLFLYHNNALDLYTTDSTKTSGMIIESIDGETPPHSSCLRTWGSKHENEVYFATTKGLPYNACHKYYVAMDIYGYSNGQGYNLYWPEVYPWPNIIDGANGVLERNKPDVIAGTWQKASMILYNTSIASGKYRFRFDNDNVNVEGRTIRFTNLMLIDLTAAFGAGNEPDLAWCDKYIVLDSDGTPYIRTKDYGSEYVSNNTNHINFIMKQKTKVVRMKIQSLDHNDNIIGEIKGYCTGGSLDISNSDMVRRSIDLQFVANNKLEINKNSPFWINKRLKIFTGIDDYKGNKYWFDHGIFIPTEPETSISLSGRTISLSAFDKMVLADNPVLTTTKIPINTPIATALKGLAELYGETKLLISNYDYNLPYDYEMSAGDNIQEAMRELTNLYMNYDIYYDTNGYLVYEKQKNRINDQPVWEFVNEKDFTISRQISADYTKVYNDFMVYGYYDDTKATQPSYHLTITDSSHPFSVNNMKRKHSLVVTEDNYLTTEQCKVRAEYEKQQAENLINNFSIITAPIYSLNDVNRVIKVTDNGNIYTCLVDSVSYPLDVRSSMQINCHEIFV